jgi:predicted chitinase
VPSRARSLGQLIFKDTEPVDARRVLVGDQPNLTIWFWLANGVGSFARSDNIQAVSKLINVGNINAPISAVNGFAERVAKTNYFKKQFGLLQ